MLGCKDLSPQLCDPGHLTWSLKPFSLLGVGDNHTNSQSFCDSQMASHVNCLALRLPQSTLCQMALFLLTPLSLPSQTSILFYLYEFPYFTQFTQMESYTCPSLNMLYSRSIHAVVCINISFLFMAGLLSILWIYHISLSVHLLMAVWVVSAFWLLYR